MKVYTVGHSTRSADELIAVLKSKGIEMLVDVRSFPRSRTNPQFNIEVMPALLAGAGIDYRHLADLGGRRSRQTPGFPSPNGFWRSDSFRNYADYALGRTFRSALETLRGLAADRTCAIMCAEAAWQRCHRQIIADYLIAAGDEVLHILRTGSLEEGRLNPGAVPQPDGSIHYPPQQGTLI